MPLPNQLAKALPSQSKIKNARSHNFGLTVHCFYMLNKTSCKCKLVQAVHQEGEHVYGIMQLIQWSDKCDTSLAVESALCTTGSPRRWSQRVSRKCCKSVGAANDVIMPLHINLAKKHPLKGKSRISWLQVQLMILCFYMTEGHHANAIWYRLCTSRLNMRTRLCHSFSDQTNAISHWLWNQPSAPPVHPEDGVKGCLGNAMKVSEPHKMSSCHSISTWQRKTLWKENQEFQFKGSMEFWFEFNNSLPSKCIYRVSNHKFTTTHTQLQPCVFLCNSKHKIAMCSAFSLKVCHPPSVIFWVISKGFPIFYIITEIL